MWLAVARKIVTAGTVNTRPIRIIRLSVAIDSPKSIDVDTVPANRDRWRPPTIAVQHQTGGRPGQLARRASAHLDSKPRNGPATQSDTIWPDTIREAALGWHCAIMIELQF